MDPVFFVKKNRLTNGKGTKGRNLKITNNKGFKMMLWFLFFFFEGGGVFWGWWFVCLVDLGP